MRLVLVVNADWFFLSHRLPLARAAHRAGAEVVVVAGDTGQGARIEREGFPFIPLPISRRGLNPFRELGTLAFLRRTYRRLRPDLAHHVTIKPVVYGSLAARAVGGMAVVNAVSGLGWAFTSNDVRARALRPVVRRLYRLALGHPRSRTIFQNPEDQSDLESLGVVRRDRSVLIRGSGVDCSAFVPSPEPSGPLLVVLASRMLWDKGVQEFVEAARMLRDCGSQARFALVGRPDDGNPSSIPASQLDAWAREGVVESWGHREDMPAVLSQASVVALPTVYGEGVPKVLLEAAAAGRPIVTTDIRGCREIVHAGINGFLVPPRDGKTLAQAIGRLLASAELRAAFGRAGRHLAETEFAESVIVEQTLEVYRQVLGNSRWQN